MNLSQITIVLDQVRHPDNLGNALRAMKNTGLSRISLSEPQTHDFERANVLATDAIDLLPRMRVFETLSEAVAHGTLIAGLTSRQLDHRPILWLEHFVRLAAEETDAGGEVVVVFGNERRGLSNAELDFCHLAVNIPTSPEKSSINLAQSVMLVAHALFSVFHHQEKSQKFQNASLETSEPVSAAPAGIVQRLYEHALPLLLEIGFLNSQNPKPIFSELKRLLERARPTKREIELLIAALKQMEREMKK